MQMRMIRNSIGGLLDEDMTQVKTGQRLKGKYSRKTGAKKRRVNPPSLTKLTKGSFNQK